MSLFVEADAKIETGEKVRIVVTKANHISITGTVEVNGIEYNVHGHYFKSDGQWSFGDRNTGDTSIRGSYRSDRPKSHWDKSPAPTVRAKIVKWYADVCDTYIEAHPESFAEAQIKHLDYEIEGVERKLAEFEQKAREQREQLMKLLAERYSEEVVNPFEKGTTAHGLYTECHARFLEEQGSGYVDPKGVQHAPTAVAQARLLWRRVYAKAVAGIEDAAPEVERMRKESNARHISNLELQCRIMQEA